MNRSQEIMEQIWRTSIVDESVFLIKGMKDAGGANASPSTKNLSDLFRSKNYVEGREFWWEGPHKLHIEDQAIDRDVLNHLDIQGGEQQ